MLTARLDESTVDEVDALVTSGAYPNRAAVIRTALDRFLATERRAAIDRAIIAGYTRIPPQPWELAAADASLRESIAEESW